MKQYIYKLIIFNLTLSLFVSMYFLYSKNDLRDVENSSKLTNSNPVDVLELKQQKQYKTQKIQKNNKTEKHKKCRSVCSVPLRFLFY